MNYEEFLKSKSFLLESSGFEANEVDEHLYPFQRDIVKWAIRKGRAAIFADCGLGKTIMQLEWANKVYLYTNKPVLILAPLAVCEQTKKEAYERLGLEVMVCESQDDVIDGINITNYEKIDKFVANSFSGVVLDESSILKSFTGKVRTKIIDNFARVPYKLACTATPAPNDYMEFGNHCEFLGIMSRTEMLSMFFVHDSGETSKWRLKGHAEDTFWEWMATWAIVLDNPKSIGYDMGGYDLPPLNVHQIIVDGDEPITEKLTLTQRRNARKDSLELRCKAAAYLINNNDEQWLVWCDLNAESDELYKVIEDSFTIKGSDKPQYKKEIMNDFSDGLIKCLITKPKIAGFGMNWQQCNNMIFVGLSDSFEAYYQAVRRCWRFGQTKPVNVYIIISAREGAVLDNINRKEADAKAMQQKMIELTKNITSRELKSTVKLITPYNATIPMIIPEWLEAR